MSVRGEGDEWDFKQTLSGLVGASARVELAKDALAFCNLPAGGTIIVGVTDDYQRVGLANSEKIDTTAIRNAIEKYIDGDFIVVAAEHTVVEPGTSEEKRYGMIYFRRRFAQPVLAALDGQVASDRPLVFRSGDILIRRGAASIRANSGDVRRLFTSSIVHEERIKAVNELWNCLVEQRRLMGGVEFIYDILADSEYPEVFSKPDFRDALGHLTEGQHASQVDRLRLRVNLVRPYLPAPNGVVTTIRFRDASVRMRYQLCSSPLMAKDITVTGQVADADLGNLFPRLFRVVTAGYTYTVHLWWWKFASPVRDGDTITIRGSRSDLLGHDIIRVSSFTRHWLKIHNP